MAGEAAPGGPAPTPTPRVTLLFRVPYMTQWGQNLVVVGAGERLGEWEARAGPWMGCSFEGETLVWTVILSVPWTPAIEYKYAVVDEQVEVVRQESQPRRVTLPGGEGVRAGGLVVLRDTWRDPSSPQHILKSAAFARVILRKEDLLDAGAWQSPEQNLAGRLRALEVGGAANGGGAAGAAPAGAGKAGGGGAAGPGRKVLLTFKVACLQVGEHQEATVVGSAPELGGWAEGGGLRMARSGDVWRAQLEVAQGSFPISYKYMLRDREGDASLLESGADRCLHLPYGEAAARPLTAMMADDGDFRLNRPWKGAGVAIPVFSLRTAASVGVGDFHDLKQLGDFCGACGMSMVQILPVNDTGVYGTWWDSYPYSSLSVHALHPQYLSLDRMADALLLVGDIRGEIGAARTALDLYDVDYEGVMAAKTRISKAMFKVWAAGGGAGRDAGFAAFLEENGWWLRPYAVFCFLKGIFGTAEHWRWGDLAACSPALIDRLADRGAEHHENLLYTYFVQYHLHRQLLDAADHLAGQGIVLKGDLPIGVDKRSVDTWMHPKLFRSDMSTGAPPDYYSAQGQNWGFPTYHWEEMAKDDYGWWRSRLKQMAKYFSALRIDHVLGFFRIWEIQKGAVGGILGRFRPSIPLWRGELEAKGIWDFNRLCDPYIRRHILEGLFASNAAEYAGKYFVEYQENCFRFRPQYATEERVKALRAREGSPLWMHTELEDVKAKLCRLHENVVLIRDPEDDQRFYPRFEFQKTSSFAELDGHTQHHLAELYHDYFYARQDKLWRTNATKTLRAVCDASDMLICGEDLGMVPDCVPSVMNDLCILSLRIQRMPTETDSEFGDPLRYPYLSVATPSCHDTSSTRGWWEEDRERAKRYFAEVLHGAGEAPEHCTPEVMRAIVEQHLQSPSCWAVFSLQDLMGLSGKLNTRNAAEETINDPSTPKHYCAPASHPCPPGPPDPPPRRVG